MSLSPHHGRTWRGICFLVGRVLPKVYAKPWKSMPHLSQCHVIKDLLEDPPCLICFLKNQLWTSSNGTKELLTLLSTIFTRKARSENALRCILPPSQGLSRTGRSNVKIQATTPRLLARLRYCRYFFKNCCVPKVDIRRSCWLPPGRPAFDFPPKPDEMQ